jgi:hypothetical protein
MNYDTASYTVGAVNAVTSGAVVQPQGPKLDFFTITKDTGAFTPANVNTLIQTIQQLATVYIYEYTDASNDTLGVAIYPTGAWTAATIDTAVTGAGIAVTVADGATFGA